MGLIENSKRVHILGICGTFMGGLAILASELQLLVSGSDKNVYPPMSTQLEAEGISLIQGFEENQLDHLSADTSIVVGNVMTRGHPVIEALLNRGIKMLSGPEWLANYVLPKRHVLAVSGTHGKTTTSSMLAWILEFAGLKPGFLIGGVPNNFGISARLGEGECFVVEADEYDSAFFDKRSKFIHYRPRTLIINNIEFDHADIFQDLEAIKKQFHHLVRIVPNNGLIIYPRNDSNVVDVLDRGCWTKTASISSDSTVNHSSNGMASISLDSNHGINSNDRSLWQAVEKTHSGEAFDVYYNGKCCGRVEWNMLGEHNIANALAAIAAASSVGVEAELAITALKHFKGVKRRMEIKGVRNHITVYDDFAHHPTAIAKTLAGLRAKLGVNAKIFAVLDIRSNTMKAGHHKEDLAKSLEDASEVYFFKSPDIAWDVEEVRSSSKKKGGVFEDKETLMRQLANAVKQYDHIVFMSNGGFGGMQSEFLEHI